MATNLPVGTKVEWVHPIWNEINVGTIKSVWRNPPPGPNHYFVSNEKGVGAEVSPYAYDPFFAIPYISKVLNIPRASRRGMKQPTQKSRQRKKTRRRN